MTRKNVLLTTSLLDRRGAERMVLELARRLDKERFKVKVACLREEVPFIDAFIAEGIDIVSLGMNRYFQIKPLIKLYQLLKAERIDLIHTHLFRDAVYGRLIARLAGVRGVISTLHNSYVWRSRAQLFLDRLTSVFADRITAVSDAVRQFAIEHEHIPAGKLVTVYNGIETAKFRVPARIREETRKKLGLSPGEIAVGSMGELTRQKGYRYLLEAAPSVLQSQPAVRFFIGGEGVLKESLISKRDKSGLKEDVTFLGFRDDVPELLSAFDIFILPSIFEGLPVSLIEAMAAGKPIVATDVDGNCEVIGDNEAGIAVEPRDPAGLARALIRLIEDPELRDRMGRKGQKRAEELFSLQVMIERYQELYEMCLQ